jgi:hypothetical protein
MKLTICSSATFYKMIPELVRELENMGISVLTPVLSESATDYSLMELDERARTKQKFIDRHLEKIRLSECILVVNFAKNDMLSYIGPNVFMEMAFAYALNKKIYVLYRIPKMGHENEILGIQPICLDGNISKIILS